jgi:hypothetical protein
VSSISKSSAASSKSAADIAAPKMPDKITVVSAKSDQVYLSWISATDNVGVMRYKIYRDQVQIDTVDGSENGYIDFTVAAGKTYLYGISAGDDSGNWSVVKSVFVQTATTQSSGGNGNVGQASSAASSVVSINNSSASVSSTSSKAAAVSSVSSTAAVTSSSSSSKAAVASSSSSSKAAVASSSSSTAAASNSSAGAENVSNVVFKSWVVAGPVSFSWAAPELRQNGNGLNITEIGGYELRYRKTTDRAYTYITINDAWQNYYNFTWLDGTYIFEIAAFDKNGLYSTFVDLTPH